MAAPVTLVDASTSSTQQGTQANPLLTAHAGLLPPAATAVVVTSGNKAAAAATVAMPAVAGETNYVCGFTVTGLGATAGSTIQITLAGIGATFLWLYTVPAGATVAAPNLTVTFPVPIPASAVNTAITLTVPSFGTGNTNAAANIWGFVQ